MKVDNPQAFAFIMQEEIYLLNKDKGLYTATVFDEAAIARADGVVESEQVITSVTLEPATQNAPVAVAPEIPGSIVQTPDNEFNYLGKNNKNFLVLVNYASEEYMSPPHLTALVNILKRKELTMDDVAILNVNKYVPVKFAALAAHFAPTRLVIMGTDALPDGIGKLPLNQPLQGKKTHVLYSFSFDEMMSRNDNKKLFWEHMKTL